MSSVGVDVDGSGWTGGGAALALAPTAGAGPGTGTQLFYSDDPGFHGAAARGATGRLLRHDPNERRLGR